MKVIVRTLALSMSAALALALSACGGQPDAADPAATPPTGDPAAPADAGMEGSGDADAAADAAPEAPATTNWICGNVTMSATYDPAAEAITLSHSGGTLILPSQRSGSGARYADDVGNEFWDSGDNAMLTLAGEAQRDCRRQH